jgi:hypothetical protein
MSTVVTTLVSGQIQITWSAPSSNGAALDAYSIQLYLPSSSTFSTDLVYCDGSQASVMASLDCAFPISYLMAQYSFPLG